MFDFEFPGFVFDFEKPRLKSTAVGGFSRVFKMQPKLYL